MSAPAKNTRQLVLYIAMSLDGFIAGEGDDLGFLTTVERPGEDYGYGEFGTTVDTLIWGRRTYDKVMSLGIDFPHRDKRCIVLSRSRSGRDENVEFYNGSLPVLIEDLRRQEGKNIYCDGGGEIVSELLRHKLIDQMIISIIPQLVGSGIPLFRDSRPAQGLRLKRSTTFPSGLVQLWYINE